MISKSTPSFIEDGVAFYLSKIKPMASVEWIELTPKSKSNEPQVTKKNELKAFEKYIDPKDSITLLDNHGVEMSSEKLAEHIEHYQMLNTKTWTLLIGGAFGFDAYLHSLAVSKISLSKLTFSHQIVRLLLLEQIYRAYSIINRLPYHNSGS